MTGKITDMTLGGAVVPGDLREASQVSGAAFVTKKVTAAMDRLFMRDCAVLLDYVQTGDTDHSAALTRALATGKPVLIPYNGGSAYTFSSTFALAANTTIFCDNGTANITMATVGALFTATSVAGIKLRNLSIDSATLAGSTIVFDGVTDGLLERVSTQRAGTDGIRLVNGCLRVLVDHGLSKSCGGNGMTIDGASTSLCSVVRRRFESNTGYGIKVSGGATDTELSFNRTLVNTLALIRVDYECSRTRIVGNHALGVTGDDGITVSGSDSAVQGNVCRGNWQNGITINGSRNAVSGNVCGNNGQKFGSDASDWAAIRIVDGNGGAGYDNSVSGNTTNDDQAAATQGWGVHIDASTYTAWATSTVTALRTFKFNGNNVYVSTNAATTGATAPVHTSGTVNDGAGTGVNWLFLFTIHTDGTLKGPCNNTFGLNGSFRNRLREDRDESGNYNASLAKIKSYGATPVNAVQGYGGDMVFRYDAASYYVSVYIKGTGTTKDKTLWQPVQPRANGSTASRVAGASGLEGAQYFNTDRNRLEVNAGAALSSAWLDALGKVDANNNITAAGSTQADATQLLYCDNAIQTAAASTGVKLPSITHVNQRMFVFNPSGGTPNVYPATGHSIDAIAANGAFATAAGGKYEFVAFSSTQWRSFKSA